MHKLRHNELLWFKTGSVQKRFHDFDKLALVLLRDSCQDSRYRQIFQKRPLQDCLFTYIACLHGIFKTS